MFTEWLADLRHNFWYDVSDLLWSLVYGLGSIWLLLQIECYFR